MKKIIAVLLALVMVLSFAACNNGNNPANENGDIEANEENNGEQGENVEASSDYKLGMGVVVNADSACDNNAQIDTTVAAVVLDKDGKIVSAKLDACQNKLKVEGGQIPDLTTVDLRTKMEKGNDYNMKAYASNGAPAGEWYEQANFFCNYIIGMTGEEVGTLELTVRAEDGYTVAADADLYAGCSIQIGEFMEAVKKACDDEHTKAFSGENWTLGLGATMSIDGSTTSATAEGNGTAALYSSYAAVVYGGDDIILCALLDAAQPKIEFDTEGSMGNFLFNGTKKELKEDYHMVEFAGAPAGEWYQQAEAFEKYATGKTASEVEATELTTRASDGYTVVADPDLYASCSIQIGDFVSDIIKATK